MNAPGIYYPQAEWFQARIGILTSSKIHAAITKRQKGGTHDLVERRKLKLQMISELRTGLTTEHFVSAAMDWGVENEPRARAEYEFRTGRTVDQLGLVLHADNPRFGATTDGFVAPEGILEIKCPETYTHYDYLTSGEIPKEYLDQIDWQMACCGPEIEWCDFVSYDPRIEDDDENMLIIRHERNNKRIAEMEDLGTEFLAETVAMFEQIKRGAKYPTTEDKLRASIKKSRGQYTHEDAELVAAFNEDIVP